MTLRILTVAVKSELDVVSARQRARQIAALCGFGLQDQVRIATAVSELARNVYNYARQGRVEFAIEGDTAPQVLVINVVDHGPGIVNLDLILSGQYQSTTGMGVGITGARRLVDRFDISTDALAGTRIVLQKLLPADAGLISAGMLGTLSGQLLPLPADVMLSEVQRQNQELLSTLAELKARQEELLQLTRELEDTNRGVVALYAELDEKAEHLRRADQMKTRFLSNMSHEFRTPLSSIRALSKLLLDRVDGELSVEQEKQVTFILKGAVGLNDLVNDLLDLAKIEAGKVDVRAAHFDVAETFSALRGMLRPLLVSERLRLTFHAPEEGCRLYSDEGKISQILRNFISNALKFTEQGAIDIRVSFLPGRQEVKFEVADTGLGIEEEHLALIFEEFSQLENHMQRGVKGTGLGLPLCRKLATLLNGYVTVESEIGQGSVFSLVVPVAYHAEDQGALLREQPATADSRIPVLVIEDQPQTRMLYEKFLADSEFRMVPATNLHEAEHCWTQEAPAAVILDILLNGSDSWQWLVQSKNNPARQSVPVIVVSEVNDKRKGLALGADAYYVKPLFRQELLGTLRQLLNRSITPLLSHPGWSALTGAAAGSGDSPSEEGA